MTIFCFDKNIINIIMNIIVMKEPIKFEIQNIFKSFFKPYIPLNKELKNAVIKRINGLSLNVTVSLAKLIEGNIKDK
jgi:hypothetical protein